MRRIGLAVVLALGLTLAPIAAGAQQTVKVPLLGILSPGSPPSEAVRQGSPFLAQLRELGWHEGSIAVEPRYAEGSLERLPALAVELVRLHVDIIVTIGTPAAIAAKQATSTIPIVITSGVEDPVRLGLVASFARPGGNVTGSVTGGFEGLGGKRLELLKEVSPRLARLAVLYNPANPSHTIQSPEYDAALKALGVQQQYVAVREAKELDHALAEIPKGMPDALLIATDPITAEHAKTIADFAVRSRLPTTAEASLFPEAGALMSYGASRSAQFRQAASYVDKILKGRKPADLPVERATKLELVINLKTAKAIGLTIPQMLLLRADQVIE